MLDQLLNFKLEDKILHFFKKHKDNLKLFAIIYLVNIGIYGQRIFFQSLSTDDYARSFFPGYHDFAGEQAAYVGRWMTDIFNLYVFSGSMHVLPYLNGLLGVTSVVIAGYVTAIFFK